MRAGGSHWFAPAVSVVAALVLAIVPLPDSIAPFRPDWVAVVLLYWSLIEPRRYGMLTAFWLGIVLDTLSGSLLGQHSLALLLIVYLSQRLHLRIRAFPASQVATLVIVLLALYELVLFLIDGFAGRYVPLVERWAPVLTGGLLWLLVLVVVERSRQAAEARM
ncbi:MAG TPA: rod shape-determining protein MreD [Gammaproteobacteria bacterium]|nr:rod shape-determining protein MreD [Gammaproteobacteria bacterium]